MHTGRDVWGSAGAARRRRGGTSSAWPGGWGARSRSRRSVRALMAAACGWRPTPSWPW